MKNVHHDDRCKATEPQVGILWLVDGKLIVASTALSMAEDYGAFKVHPGDHCSVWEKLQRGGAVPVDVEYEECPRGRVMYDVKARRFSLLVDRCILRDKRMVTTILTTMKLPRNDTDIGTDSHYPMLRLFAWQDRRPGLS
jgi:hypothetical protein